jgi:hypothetical protein
MIANSQTLYSQSGASYADRLRANRLAFAAKMAIGAADVYTACAGAVSPVGSVVHRTVPIMSGIAAAGHAIYGVTKMMDDVERDYYGYVKARYPKTPAEKAVGMGHVVTAAGFAMLACGMGLYALPVIALGEATALLADKMGSA